MKRLALIPILLVSSGLAACSGGGGGRGGSASTVAPSTSASTTPTSTTGPATSSTTASTASASTGVIVSVTTPQGVSRNDVKILYRLIDPASATYDISVDFSTDNGVSWQAARMGQGGDGVVGLKSAPGPKGLEHTYVWNSLADLGPKLASCLIRITPVANQPGLTSAFTVDDAALNASVTITREPYLQSMTKSSVMIVWKTQQSTDSVVEYGDTASLGQTAGNPQAKETTHVVTLTNLKPATTYTYRIGGSGGAVTTRETFTTAPDSTSQKFRFLAFGDSGTGSQGQMDVAAKMAGETFDFAIHMGDVVYPLGLGGDYDPKFFKPYAPFLKKACMFPSVGNHDMYSLGIGYKNNFYITANNPAGSKLYYSFEWGDSKFISLETSALLGVPWGAESQWLENELASSTKTWNIVYFHVPLFSSGTHGENGSLQSRLGPLFEKYKVALVIQGHDHDYERTNPIKKWSNDPNFHGIPYIVTGGGGADPRSMNPHSYTAKSESVCHYLLCDVNGKTLTGTAKRADGSVLDTFTVQAR